jgi:2-oxoglutarate dehydrogenase E1 component
LIERAGELGVESITMGMAHRGRLNVLANVIGHFCERIFTSFEGSIHPEFPADEGDVKYHQGAAGERETSSGKKVALRLSPTPATSKQFDPVVEGMARAGQDHAMAEHGQSRDEAMSQSLPVLLHGDAAFAGQGIVMETLQLASCAAIAPADDSHHHQQSDWFTTSPKRAALRFIQPTSPA